VEGCGRDHSVKLLFTFLEYFMSQQLFSLYSWPRAIVHIDGDAFFTSCEEAIHPELKGKALITEASAVLSPAPAIRLKN